MIRVLHLLAKSLDPSKSCVLQYYCLVNSPANTRGATLEERTKKLTRVLASVCKWVDLG